MRIQRVLTLHIFDEPCYPKNKKYLKKRDDDVIKFQFKYYTIAYCVVDEGVFFIILSMHALIGMGSPSLVMTINQPLAFDRRPSQTLGFLSQTHVTLGGKTVLVDFML